MATILNATCCEFHAAWMYYMSLQTLKRKISEQSVKDVQLREQPQTHFWTYPERSWSFAPPIESKLKQPRTTCKWSSMPKTGGCVKTGSLILEFSGK